MKCVIVIDAELPLGLIANTCAVLALTLGREIDGIIGESIADASDTIHQGITQITLPILKAAAADIRQLRNDAQAAHLFVVDFCDAAQTSKTYADYGRKVGATSSEKLNYLGLAIYGDKKQITRLTGSLPLLR